MKLGAEAATSSGWVKPARRGARRRRLPVCTLAVAAVLVAALPGSAGALQTKQRALEHGLWVWKAPSVAGTSAGASALRAFCTSHQVNAVYLSNFDVSEHPAEATMENTIVQVHAAGIHVEALFSSTDADEPGEHREKLLDEVRAVVAYDRDEPNARFDGIHLDIEPQQRAENKGSANLWYLPDLVATYRDVRDIADPAHLTVDADIERKLLEGDVSQRRSLMSALPRLTLMLYGLNSRDGGSTEKQAALTLRADSEKYLAMAYRGLGGNGLATMVIGLRTRDYGTFLPAMLATVEAANRANAHYGGWALHAYNDSSTTAR